MTVKKITLLSVEECQQYQAVIPPVRSSWWWLRSSGHYQNSAAIAFHNGSIGEYGCPINRDDGAIRPTLKLNLEIADNQFWYKPEKLIGTKIKYGKYNWTVLDAEVGELCVFCDEFIAKRRFDPESNDWDRSELKQWLETEGLKLITK